MKKEFKTEITKTFSDNFEIKEEGLYTITIKVSCKPGWKNKWWLWLKGKLEDILDLHLDDEDLRVEIDGLKFGKPKGKRGLFNSPAAFSGTKILGKTKTVVFILYLTKGIHIINFVSDGSPYLESVEVDKINNRGKIIFYLNAQAEDENYYSWYTFTLVNLPLKLISLTAQSGIKEGVTDDDDLKVIINSNLQKNPNSKHKHSYFCGFTLKGKEDIFSKTLNFSKDTHYIELLADKTPILKTVKLLLEEEQERGISDPVKKEDVFNPQYVMKNLSFINSNSMNEEAIEEFLKRYGKNYPSHIYHRFLEGRKAFFWIEKFSGEFGINPRIILTKLQAEKGLINGDQSTNPSEEQLDYALGVGCLPNRPCDPKFKGFVTQINSDCQTLRNNFERAGTSNFEIVMDGTIIKAVNKATFSILKYSPFLSSVRLFYDVYKGFFGAQDLGGDIEVSPKPRTKIFSFLAVVLISLSLFSLIAGRIFFFHSRVSPLENFSQEKMGFEPSGILGIEDKNLLELPEHHFTIYLSGGYRIKLEMNIDKIKRLKPEEYWCGSPFLVDYEGEAQAAILDRNGAVVDHLDLTSPSLVLGKPPDYDFYFYEVYDLDGDGEKKEFIVLTYFSCSGNFLEVVRIDKEKKQFTNLPFKLEKGIEEKVFVGPGRKYFEFDNGQLWIKYYDVSEERFHKDIFQYKRGVFEKVSSVSENI